MFIGVFLILTTSVFLVTLFIRSFSGSSRQNNNLLSLWFRLYVGYSLLIASASLALYIILSVWIEIFSFGAPSSYNIPQDYFEQGIIGWLLLLIGAAGILSPLLAVIATEYTTSRKS